MRIPLGPPLTCLLTLTVTPNSLFYGARRSYQLLFYFLPYRYFYLKPHLKQRTKVMPQKGSKNSRERRSIQLLF